MSTTNPLRELLDFLSAYPHPYSEDIRDHIAACEAVAEALPEAVAELDRGQWRYNQDHGTLHCDACGASSKTHDADKHRAGCKIARTILALSGRASALLA